MVETQVDEVKDKIILVEEELKCAREKQKEFKEDLKAEIADKQKKLEMLNKEKKKANDFKRDLEYVNKKLIATETQVRSLKTDDTDRIMA